jgi:two-component system response regulator AlgR
MSAALSPPLSVLIVDDEQLARLRLASLLRELSADLALAHIGEAADAAQALAALAAHPCEVVLLDVQMPGIDGTQLAARLRALPRAPSVVFVTAHAEHALAAFELDAVDYLTKPVRLERLRAAMLRVVQRRSANAAGADGDDVLIVHERGRVIRVPVLEVLYLKAELKYVTLRTAAHSYVLDDALADLEQRLGARFVRVHRNALVAKRAVRALERRSGSSSEEGDAEGWAVRVAPLDEWLSVSRRQVVAVREALLEPR